MFAVAKTYTSFKPSEWFLWFVFYSFWGWVGEVIYAYMIHGYFVNRGFLFGPLCPIYGIVALLSIVILYGRIKNVALIFLIGAALVTIVEYITSLGLESLFHARWWDYSDLQFHINGRVSLWFTILFGVVVALGVKIVHPRIETLTERITDRTKHTWALVLAGMIAFDLCITVIRLIV